MIAGMNHEEISQDVPYDYFSRLLFYLGMASWKRVIDQWDESYSFLDDAFNMKQLSDIIKQRSYRKDFISTCQFHKKDNKAYYESIFRACMLFNSGLSIVPTKNMINNLGASVDSTHFTSSFDLMPRGLRRIFTMKRYELTEPLKHPRYVIENVGYKDRLYKIQGWGHPWIKIGRSFEELYLNLLAGNFAIIMDAVKKRVLKILGKRM